MPLLIPTSWARNQYAILETINLINIPTAAIYFEDGFVVPMHSHHNEQITQVVKGQMRFEFGGDDPKELLLNPGDVVVIPPNLPHAATCIGPVEEIDMWSPRRDDWLDGSDAYLRG